MRIWVARTFTLSIDISFERLVLSKSPISPKPALFINTNISFLFDSFLPSFMQLLPSDKSQAYISQSVSSVCASSFKALVFLDTRIRL